MKKLCIIIAFLMTLSLCGCSQRRITKTAVTAVTWETTSVSPKLVMLSSSVAEPAADSDGRTNKRLACVIRVKVFEDQEAVDDNATTLLVNLYDEHGRITSTTNGDVTIDYEYDEDSRLISESEYFKGLYQGCCLHDYVGNRHSVTAYSADGSAVYDGETYEEFWNNNGQPTGKIVYINEKEHYTCMAKDYDRKTGWIVTDCIQSPDNVEKDLRHSYEVNDRGNLVETVTDRGGKIVSETTYLGEERSEDKILRYEEYDSEGNTIRGFENHYVEINGRNVLDSKATMEINAISGKITADIYFYSSKAFNIEDDIYESMGMAPDDFSRLTVHSMNSGYDDVAITYSSSGIKTKTVTSKKDDSGRVVEVKETSKNSAWVSSITFEYDAFGNCKKMIVEDRDNITEYIFGYISIPNSYCEPFGSAQAMEYIGK